MEQLDPRQIHLWLAFLDEITDLRLLTEYRLLLSEEELRQHARFHFQRDRHRYLVTRALVRSVLSQYVDVAPQRWRFVVNAHGKPSIAAEHVAARHLEFNISHTEGLVVLGIALGHAIGVDVENVTRQVEMQIASRYFAADELRTLYALPRKQQLQRFFEYWTLKESYIKARGVGLSIPLQRFSFHLDDSSRIRLTLDRSLGDSADRWSCWQLPVADKYLVAVCAERDGGASIKLMAPHLWSQPGER
jgi:4'-phosphopantetheinyl transferase